MIGNVRGNAHVAINPEGTRSGTHRETGRAWRQAGLVLLRLTEGQIAERWSLYVDA